jgi:hypothetical protein
MDKKEFLSAIDKSYFSVLSGFNDAADKVYWLNQDYSTRLQSIELLRKINYGHDSLVARLQRVLEIAAFKKS